jgi:hypothetical protein
MVGVGEPRRDDLVRGQADLRRPVEAEARHGLLQEGAAIARAERGADLREHRVDRFRQREAEIERTGEALATVVVDRLPVLEERAGIGEGRAWGVLAAVERGRRRDHLERRSRRIATLCHAVEQRPVRGVQRLQPGGGAEHRRVRVEGRPRRERDHPSGRRLDGHRGARVARRLEALVGSRLHRRLEGRHDVVAPDDSTGDRVELAREHARQIRVRAGQVVVLRLLEPAAVGGRGRVPGDLREDRPVGVAPHVDAAPVSRLARHALRQHLAVRGEDPPSVDRLLAHDLVQIVLAGCERRRGPQLPIGREAEQQHEAGRDHDEEADELPVHQRPPAEA